MEGDFAVVDKTPELIVADASAWRSWLHGHQSARTGVWLVLAKKGNNHPTSLTYDQALEEALCYGWGVMGGLTAARR